MCVHWGSVPDWIVALGTVATAVIAGVALVSWRLQIHAAARHTAAAEIAEAAHLMRYHFYEARNPFKASWEFPKEYFSKPDAQRTNADEAEAYAHLYNERWKLLRSQVIRLATLRAKAGALLGEDRARAVEDLTRTANGLVNMFQEHVQQIRAGEEIVAQWADQEWVQRVQQSVEVYEERADPFSREFESKFNSLTTLLAGDLSLGAR